MVNPKPHKVTEMGGRHRTLWYCSRCDKLYDYKEHAKECCTPRSPFYGDDTPSVWRY
jgi:hypothetical protein